MKKIILIPITIILVVLLVLFVRLLPAPSFSQEEELVGGLSENYIQNHVSKFRDGNTTCYIFTVAYGGGISCIKD